MLTAKRWFSPDCTPEAEDRSGNRIVVAPFARCAERGPVIKVSLASVRQTDARWGGTGNHSPEGAWTARKGAAVRTGVRLALGSTQRNPRQASLGSAGLDASASAGRRNDCAFRDQSRRGRPTTSGQANTTAGWFLSQCHPKAKSAPLLLIEHSRVERSSEDFRLGRIIIPDNGNRPVTSPSLSAGRVVTIAGIARASGRIEGGRSPRRAARACPMLASRADVPPRRPLARSDRSPDLSPRRHR
jgi:hypothetical protein